MLIISVECWIRSSANKPLPRFAIKAGFDEDATPIYVGRCEHEGDMLPAKVIPSKGWAYVTWGGEEHKKINYEVLTGPGYSWQRCSDGDVPINAITCGDTSDGEHLFIGRGRQGDSLTVGKVQLSHQCLYIPFDGMEIKLNTYEVLVRNYTHIWQATRLDAIPYRAVVAGEDCDGTTIYVARALHNGVMVPAKFIPDREEAYVCDEGSEIHVDNVEVLIGSNYIWRKAVNMQIPKNAVYTGYSSEGEPLFVARGRYENSICPGVVSFKENCLLAPFGGRQVRIKRFEVLYPVD